MHLSGGEGGMISINEMFEKFSHLLADVEEGSQIVKSGIKSHLYMFSGLPAPITDETW